MCTDEYMTKLYQFSNKDVKTRTLYFRLKYRTNGTVTLQWVRTISRHHKWETFSSAYNMLFKDMHKEKLIYIRHKFYVSRHKYKNIMYQPETTTWYKVRRWFNNKDETRCISYWRWYLETYINEKLRQYLETRQHELQDKIVIEYVYVNKGEKGRHKET
jgi:hypothetical protein